VTGREYTLFRGGEVYSAGAVGFALLDDELRHNYGFEDYAPISPAYNVTAASGNLIHSLDNKNPVTELLHATASLHLGGGPRINLYLGILDSNGKTYLDICRINAGGPSKGILALDDDNCVAVGSQVQFLREPDNFQPKDTTEATLESGPDDQGELKFMSTSETMRETDFADSSSNVQVLDNKFLACSENGIILPSFAGGHRKSSAPGAWGSIRCS